MLCLIVILVEPLALLVPVPSYSVTTETYLAYFSFQSAHGMLVYYQKNTEQAARNRCGEIVEFAASVLLSR